MHAKFSLSGTIMSMTQTVVTKGLTVPNFEYEVHRISDRQQEFTAIYILQLHVSDI